MNSNKDCEDMHQAPEISSSFFDDKNLTGNYDFFPFNSELKVPSKPTVIDLFQVLNVNKKTTIEGLFGLFDHYIGLCIKDNDSIKQYLLIEADKAKIHRKKEMKNGMFSFDLIKNGTVFRFISEKGETIDNWVDSLRLICFYTDYHEQYKTINFIGTGTFARICLSEHKKTKEKVAVKAFCKVFQVAKMKDKAKDALTTEINVMKALSHKNIVKLYETYETKNTIYLIMEYVNGRTLEQFMKEASISEEIQIKKIMKGIFEGLSHLASKKIMHRDLKPDNILIDENDNPKIIDFGLATFIDEKEYLFPRCGTPGYIAPEVFRYNGGGPKSFYSDKCDIFSAGCIFFYLLFGDKFFKNGTISTLLVENKSYNCNNESLCKISEELSNPNSTIPSNALEFLMRLLEFDPRRRPTASQSLQLGYLSQNLKAFSNKDFSSKKDLTIKLPTDIDASSETQEIRNDFSDISPPKGDSPGQSMYLSMNSTDSPPKIQSNTPHSLKDTPTFKEGVPFRTSRFSGKFKEQVSESYIVSPTKTEKNSLLKKILINETLKNIHSKLIEARKDSNYTPRVRADTWDGHQKGIVRSGRAHTAALRKTKGRMKNPFSLSELRAKPQDDTLDSSG